MVQGFIDNWLASVPISPQFQYIMRSKIAEDGVRQSTHHLSPFHTQHSNVPPYSASPAVRMHNYTYLGCCQAPSYNDVIDDTVIAGG